MADFNLLVINSNNKSENKVVRDYSKYNEFASNLQDIERLWRLADTRHECNFRLRTFSDGTLEEDVSLIELLPSFIDANVDSHFDEFDLFFSYMVYVLKRKVYPKNKVAISCFKVMCLKIQVLLSRIRSEDDFFNKVAHIKLSIREKQDPCHNHWELIYVNSDYHENKELSDLLTSCCDPENIIDVPLKYDEPYFIRTFGKDLIGLPVPELAYMNAKS